MRLKSQYIKPQPVSPLNVFLGKTFTKYAGNPIIDGGSRDVDYTNLCPGGMALDPLDSSRTVFLMGEFTGPTTIDAQISLYLIDNDDPYTLTPVGVVLSGTPGTDDETGCRFGAGHPIFHDGLWYYFYVGISTDFKWRIFRSTTTDFRSFTKLGMCMDFNDVDEKSLSGAGVYIDSDGRWHMVYTAWNGIGSFPNNNPGSSQLGLKHAYSDDLGETWTKTGYVVPMGPANALNDNHTEDGGLYKFGDQWVIMMSAEGGSGTNRWRCALAYSWTFDKPFVNYGQALIDLGPTGFDTSLTACPLYWVFPDGTEVIYYQGADAGDDIIDIGAVTLT